MKGIVLIFILILCSKAFPNEDLLQSILFSDNLTQIEKRDSIYNNYFSDDEPVNQLISANHILDLVSETDLVYWKYLGNYLKANAYIYMAEPDRAIEFYLKSLDEAQDGNMNNGYYFVYLGLGNAFSISGDSKQCIRYNKLALETLKNDDYLHKGYILINIIDEMQKMELTDSVDYYLNIADSLFSLVNDKKGLAYVKGNRAILFVKAGNYAKAEENFSGAIDNLLTNGGLYDLVTFQIELAKVYYLKQKTDIALAYALKSFKQSTEANFNELSRDVSKLLFEIYQSKEDYQNAFFYQSKYIELNDSICNREAIQKVADLRTEHEVSQKQLEINLLEKKRQLNRIVIIAVFIILLVVSFLTYLINKNLKIVKKQRKKLIKQKQELEDLIKVKDKMFSIISHDLRGPLHSLTGVSGLIRELIKNDNKEILVEVGDSLGKSLGSITLLLDNLLEWSLNEQGKIPLKPEYLDAYNVFVELYEIFYGPAEAKGINLIMDIPKETNLQVDYNTFSTIFRNLISNAIKFSNKDDSITINVENLPDKIIFLVADTGVGMNKEKQDELFKFTGTKSTYGTASERGIGLGMRLASEFTNLNKGNISVKSEEGNGTTFFVEFSK